MRKIKVETMIPTNFKWIARDQDCSLHIFEKQPNLDYGTNANPLACDMWDVYEGETMQITPKTAVSAGLYQDELGDWRDSCKELLTMYEK